MDQLGLTHLSLSVSDLPDVLAVVGGFGGSVVEATVSEQSAMIRDPDGQLRFVICETDPGVANWLELTGRRRGYVQIRWQRLAADLGSEHGPRVEIVLAGSVPALLPYYDQARLAPGEYAARIAARQAAVAERMLG